LLAIAAARASNSAYDTPEFWRRDDVAARSTFQKWRSHDPAFAAALPAVIGAAERWQTEKTAWAVQTAIERLQMAAPGFATTLIALSEDAEREHVKLSAAKSGLELVIRLANDARLADILSKIDVQKLTDDQLEAFMVEKPEAALMALLRPLIRNKNDD